MQFYDVAISHQMIGSNLLTVEFCMTPNTRESHRLLQVLVHQSCEVAHRLAAVQRERRTTIGRPVRRFRVDAHDAELAEEPWAELTEPVPGGGRDRHRWVAKLRELAQRSELRLGIGDTVRLVRKH